MDGFNSGFALGAGRGYCGARASFDGIYYEPEPGCERAAVRKTRAEFKRLYDKKAYADARSTLEPVLTKCKKTLDLDSDGWIRSWVVLLSADQVVQKVGALTTSGTSPPNAIPDR